jgi:hypothetical protein
MGTIRRLLLVAGPLSFGWEMGQMSGLTGMPAAWLAGTAVCAFAAVTDVLIVLGLFGLGRLAFRERRWFVPPRPGRYAAVIVAGVALNAAIEWWLVQRLGLFGYTAVQPIVPGVNIGLFSVLQPVVVLPLGPLARGPMGTRGRFARRLSREHRSRFRP